MLSKLIDRDAFSEVDFDKLLALIGHLGNDFDKKTLYKKLIDKNRLTEEEWSNLIGQTERLGSDFEKSEILVRIAKNMPKNDTLRTVYMRSAKTINADQEYGKTLRAIE